MISKIVLEDLYNNQKLSMVEVAQRLGMTSHRVEWWMKKYDIPRRNWSEASYVKHNPTGDPFKIEESLNVDRVFLKGLALGLFWGEGNKANAHAVRLGNTDPHLIKLFVHFLRVVCNVDENKIRFALQIFEDINEEEAMGYWLGELGVTRNKFLPKIVMSPRQGKGTYRKVSKYGVVTVIVCNTKLRKWIGEEIEKTKNMPT